MEKSKRFYHRKKVLRGMKILLMLFALWVISNAIYWLQLQDDFYASAIPGDPVRMGMKPRDVLLGSGIPDDKWVVEDFIQIGFAGNNYEIRPTGEVYLYYWRHVLGQDARLSYLYHKWGNRVREVSGDVGNYATLSEAVDVAGQAIEYAHTAFAQKGNYAFESKEGGLDCRFRVERPYESFYLEISVHYRDMDHSEAPYYVHLYQSLFQY